MGKSFNLRLPPDLQTKLAKEAAKANRSLNGEIVHRLTESLKVGKPPLPTAPSVTGLRREHVIAAVSVIQEWMAKGDKS
jgi:hypothetical protein